MAACNTNSPHHSLVPIKFLSAMLIESLAVINALIFSTSEILLKLAKQALTFNPYY